MPNPADLWNFQLDNPATPQKGDKSPASLMLQQAYRQSTLAVVQLREIQGQLAGLTAAMQQLAGGGGIDMDAITSAAQQGARDGVSDAISSIDVTVRSDKAGA